MIFFQIVKAAEEVTHAASSTSIAGMFGLDWKLFLAQLVNFAIVLLILWKWVFKPVTAVLEKRTKHIEDSLKSAELIETQKKEFEQWKSKEIGETRKQAGEIISQSKHDAEKVREEILAKAKQEQEKLTTTTRATLESEKERMIQEAKKELADVVVAAAQAVLGREIDQKDNEKFIKQAIREIR